MNNTECLGSCQLYTHCQVILDSEDVIKDPMTIETEAEAALTDLETSKTDNRKAFAGDRLAILHRFADDPESMKAAMEQVLSDEDEIEGLQQTTQDIVEQTHQEELDRLARRRAEWQHAAIFLGKASRAGCHGPIERSSGIFRRRSHLVCQADVPVEVKQDVEKDIADAKERIRLAFETGAAVRYYIR